MGLFAWFQKAESEVESNVTLRALLVGAVGPARVQELEFLLGAIAELANLPPYTGPETQVIGPLVLKARQIGQVAADIKADLDKLTQPHKVN